MESLQNFVAFSEYMNFSWKDPLVNSNQLFWNWQKSLLRKTTTNRYFFAIIKRVRNSAQILHNVAKKFIKLHFNIHTLESNEKISIFAKGQWISEWIYEVIVSPKIWTKYFTDALYCATMQGRTFCIFRVKRWHYKFILKFSDLESKRKSYIHCSVWVTPGIIHPKAFFPGQHTT